MIIMATESQLDIVSNITQIEYNQILTDNGDSLCYDVMGKIRNGEV